MTVAQPINPGSPPHGDGGGGNQCWEAPDRHRRGGNQC